MALLGIPKQFAGQYPKQSKDSAGFSRSQRSPGLQLRAVPVLGRPQHRSCLDAREERRGATGGPAGRRELDALGALGAHAADGLCEGA